jgi:hypothetical protein
MGCVCGFLTFLRADDSFFNLVIFPFITYGVASVEELVEQLESLCSRAGVDKFSAGEMVELLEDGEEVEWILDQIGQQADGSIGQLLQEIAAQAAPERSDDKADEDVAEEQIDGADAVDASEDEEEFDPSDLDIGELQSMLPPGVDMGQVQKMLASPRGALLADFGAFCQERGVEMEADQGEMSEAMQELHEEWLNTPRESLEGKKPADVLDGGRLFPTKVETFRREAPKVGRNDPCPCGSGKKYKKCCAKAA